MKSKATKSNILSQIDDFTKGYLEAALWAENDSNGEPLDSKYNFNNFTKSALKSIIIDCKAFQEKAANFLSKAYELYNPTDSTVEEYAGHDFWLTRNGHGVGFWDRGFPDDIGDGLSDIARSFGGCTIFATCGYIGIV